MEIPNSYTFCLFNKKKLKVLGKEVKIICVINKCTCKEREKRKKTCKDISFKTMLVKLKKKWDNMMEKSHARQQ